MTFRLFQTLHRLFMTSIVYGCRYLYKKLSIDLDFSLLSSITYMSIMFKLGVPTDIQLYYRITLVII